MATAHSPTAIPPVTQAMPPRVRVARAEAKATPIVVAAAADQNGSWVQNGAGRMIASQVGTDPLQDQAAIDRSITMISWVAEMTHSATRRQPRTGMCRAAKTERVPAW